MRLKDRKILITGAASGIGRSTAELFAREGAKVALLDRDASGLESVAASTGGVVCVADLTDEATLQAAVERAASTLGGLDGVVNAAGIVVHAPLAESTTATWRKVVEVNLIGTYLVCRLAQPWLAKEERATIVNLASGQALLPSAGNSAYAASKAGVVTLGRTLAIELAPRIRVNTVAPGLINTPMGQDAMQLQGEGAAERLAAAVDKYALKRMGEPEEIAQALLFLTSWDSSLVTGALLAVDAGRTFH